MNKLDLFYKQKEKTITTIFLLGVFIGGAIVVYLLATGKIK